MHAGSFALSDGRTLHLQAWKPAGEPRACVLFLHGVESHAGWFEETALYLAHEESMIAFAFDRPGWGRSDGPRGHLPAYAEALRQVGEVAQSLRATYGNVHLAGLSWGGLLALYAALRRGALFDSLTLIAPGLCPKRDLALPSKLLATAAVVLQRPTRPVRLLFEPQDFTRRTDRAAWIRDDAYRTHSVSAQFCLETLKMRRFVQEQIARRRLPPTQLLLAGQDSIVDNDRTRGLLHPATCRSTGGTTDAAAVIVQEYETAAHSLVFEAPQRTAQAIARLATALPAEVPPVLAAAVACPAAADSFDPNRVVLSPLEEKTGLQQARGPVARQMTLFNAELLGEDVAAEATERPAEEIPVCTLSALPCKERASPQIRPAGRAAASTTPADAMQPRVAVMGAGGIGSLVGGLLALGGVPVVLVAREKHARAVNEEGLRLQLADAARTVRSHLSAVTDPTQVEQPAELVILAVKGFDTPAALEQMRPLVGPETILLSLQNGLDNEHLVAAAYPDHAVVAGAICAHVEFGAPGAVRWGDDRGGLALAAYRGEDEAAARAADLLRAGGMEVRLAAGPQAAARVKWSKLMLNVAFNALNALTGLSAGAILAHAEHGPLAVRALQEGFAVMRAQGLEPVALPGYDVPLLEKVTRLPARLSAKLLGWRLGGEDGAASSLRQDLMKRARATEVDAIHGAVVRAGEEHGVAAPANRELLARVEAARREFSNETGAGS